MKNSNANGNTTRTINGKTKGPKPIQTLAQLKENILRDALAKEVKKIDKVLDRAEKQRRIAHAASPLPPRLQYSALTLVQ